VNDEWLAEIEAELQEIEAIEDETAAFDLVREGIVGQLIAEVRRLREHNRELYFDLRKMNERSVEWSKGE
jgi:hypothetical protein